MIYRVWHCPWFLAPAGGLGTYPPQKRGSYCTAEGKQHTAAHTRACTHMCTRPAFAAQPVRTCLPIPERNCHRDSLCACARGDSARPARKLRCPPGPLPGFLVARSLLSPGAVSQTGAVHFWHMPPALLFNIFLITMHSF